MTLFEAAAQGRTNVLAAVRGGGRTLEGGRDQAEINSEARVPPTIIYDTTRRHALAPSSGVSIAESPLSYSSQALCRGQERPDGCEPQPLEQRLIRETGGEFHGNVLFWRFGRF